ncbi:MAG TPA: CotH kinase family protein, partial [Humisphaera sp.]
DVGADLRVTIGGQVTEYRDVATHLKGSAGSLRGIDDKAGFTLSFDHFKKGQEFNRLTKINLNNGAQDGTYMVENLGNALFRDAGIPGCRCTNARVWLNGKDLGVYVLKEGFDDPFLRRFFADPHGTLYEGGFVRDVNGGLAERVNTSRRDRDFVKEFVAAAGDTDPARRRARLEKAVDVDRFYTFMAMEALTAHWDGYTGNRNNYRVYHDPAVNKMVFLPHGMDQLFQQPGYPLVPTNALVAQALVATPEDRAKYLERVKDLRERVLTPENVNNHVDRISAALAPAMKELGPDAARQHEENTRQLRGRVLERIRNVDRQLGVAAKPLKFDAQGYTAVPPQGWEDKVDSGPVRIDRVADGRRALARFKADGASVASVRQTFTLPQGKYVLEGSVRLNGVTIADGTPNAGVGLRISGATRTGGLKGTADWTKVTWPIEVTEPSQDVVLVAECRATAGEATFDLGSFRLRKQ